MATSIFADILKWSEQRPDWQRDALRRVFTAGQLTADDLDELTEICKSKHGLAGPKTVVPLAAQHLPITGTPTGEAVSLISLTHHNGVNALAAEQTVSFGPNLTIVFGENGAGKSGYTRILKRACRSRFVEDILGDVLGSGAPFKAKATIQIKEGATPEGVPWSADVPPSPELAQISVFDSHCVPVYLKDKTDVAFRPSGLDVFDKLAAASAEVKKRLEAGSQPLTQALLPPLPTIATGTKARQCVDSLSALTSKQDVRTLATLSVAEEQRLKHLSDLKRDLQATDPKKRTAELVAKATRADLLAGHLEGLEKSLGLAALKGLGEARSKLQTAQRVLATLRQAALAPDLLPGTGGAVWRGMWDATKEFSSAAIPGKAFPVTEDGAKCPFCQQALDADTASRLKHLAEFVTSTAQEDVRAAEAEYAALWNAITGVQIQRPDMDAIVEELSADDASLQGRVTQYVANAQDLRDRVAKATADSQEPMFASTFDTQVPKAIRAVSEELRTRAKELQSSATSLSAAEQAELTELEARVALRDNLSTVLAGIDRKRQLAAYSSVC